MSDRIKRIKACLNGKRGRDEHPGVPVTPAELAASAAAAVAAGAEAVHLHARGADGAESVLAADIGARAEVNQHAASGADDDEPLDGEPVPTMDEALGTEGAEGEAPAGAEPAVEPEATEASA